MPLCDYRDTVPGLTCSDRKFSVCDNFRHRLVVISRSKRIDESNGQVTISEEHCADSCLSEIAMKRTHGDVILGNEKDRNRTTGRYGKVRMKS